MPDRQSSSDADKFPMLEHWEELMTDKDEAVHRQVHPRFYDQGIISDEAFVAREDEQRKLSSTRNGEVSAECARRHYTDVLNLASIGVAELTVGEVEEELSRCVDDSTDPNHELPPGHCYIDFRGLTKTARRELREALAEIATERGLVG
ncbi:hypothetical protein [Brachybacterium saurashtrense]|uniref:hypothetical protein n=1 Tax=Brachybacterium saurashtrense TaxID=556288 RepID=UPI000F8DF8D5|nr:hypothetical protein [Brachybacterium saurashtrense]